VKQRVLVLLVAGFASTIVAGLDLLGAHAFSVMEVFARVRSDMERALNVHRQHSGLRAFSHGHGGAVPESPTVGSRAIQVVQQMRADSKCRAGKVLDWRLGNDCF
jgi:hypothetical protein